MVRFNRAERTAILLFLAFIALSVLSGCSLADKFKQTGNGDDNWENDVLWARECGQDGLRCCADDPQCFYGQECCINPNNRQENYCAADCTCGVEGAYCCTGDTPCSDNLACYLDKCTECGGETEPCCPGDNTCENDLLCHKDLCVACGEPGNPCCAGDIACRNQGADNALRTECLESVCVYCGSAGQIACPNEPVCLTGTLLNNGFCFQCGTPNQPCCDQNSGVEWACDPKLGLVCDRGFCTKK